ADRGVLAGTAFSGWRVPGVLLAGLAGGGFLLAGWWQWRGHRYARELSMAAGAGAGVLRGRRAGMDRVPAARSGVRGCMRDRPGARLAPATAAAMPRPAVQPRPAPRAKRAGAGLREPGPLAGPSPPAMVQPDPGCHLGRDTAAAVERAGFTIHRAELFDPFPRWVLARPMLGAIAAPAMGGPSPCGWTHAAAPSPEPQRVLFPCQLPFAHPPPP